MLVSAEAWAAAKKPAHKKPPLLRIDQVESPAEGLMLEHALAERLLLIYEENMRRLRAQEAVAARTILDAAHLLRRVVEDYHQQSEEASVFPHFENHAELGPLVKTLRGQHTTLRKLTDTVLDDCVPSRFATEAGRRALLEACAAYTRMSRVHMAFETTQVFAALDKTLPEKTIGEIAEQIQGRRTQALGDEGLGGILTQIGRLERELRIDGPAAYASQGS